jgi:hypothetical protein
MKAKRERGDSFVRRIEAEGIILFESTGER